MIGYLFWIPGIYNVEKHRTDGYSNNAKATILNNRLNMKNRLNIIFLLLVLLAHISNAQDPVLLVDEIFPPSPEASALGKYGEYPVSLYTGIPNISIPIWDVKTKQIHVPVSLSYHASGIHVDEVSTNVGLGWVLNAGGIITRSMRGKADDATSGYYNASFDESTIESGQHAQNIADGLVDGEADVFYYNFCGQSGRFFFNLDQEIVLNEKQDLKISHTYNQAFTEFIITTPDGTKYYFGSSCYDCSGEDYREETMITNQGHMMSVSDYFSSWYLRKIESLNGEEIFFHYDAIGISEILQSVNKTVVLNAETFTQIAEQENISYSKVLDQKILDSISYDGGAVEFYYNTERDDINNGNSFDLIKIRNSLGDIVRQFELVHSYFDYDYDVAYGKRLRLDSIIESDANETLQKPYILDYFEIDNTPMPPRRASWGSVTANEYYSQDHWGFFNGKEYNYSLVPTFAKETKVYQSADREPKWPYTKVNMLDRIEYPAGGYTEFEFEPNAIGYQGNDTITEYFKETTLSGYMDHCDLIYTSVYADTFDIHDYDNNDIEITLSQDVTNCSDQASNPGFSFTIEAISAGAEGDSWSLSYDAPNPTNLLSVSDSLIPGQYCIRAIYHKYAEFNWSMTYQEHVEEDVIIERELEPYGGVRIKSIKNYDTNDSLETSEDFIYLTNINTGESTGQPINKPSYYQLQSKVTQYPWNSGGLEMTSIDQGFLQVNLFRKTFGIPDPNLPNYDDLPDYLFVNALGIALATGEVVLSSSPTYELGSTQGGIIGYSSVIKTNGMGGECQVFSSVNDYPEKLIKYGYYSSSGGSTTLVDSYNGDNTDFPYPPVGSMDQFRGKLLHRIVFDSTYQTVLKEMYEYEQAELDSCSSLKASPMISVSEGSIVGAENEIKSAKYQSTSSFFPLIKKKEVIYVDDDPAVEKEIKYSYLSSNHYQLSEEEVFTSTGDSILTEYYYPYDSEVSSFPNRSAMVDSNLVQVPLRVDVFHNNTLIKRNATYYNDELLPEFAKEYDLDASAYRNIVELKDYDGPNLQEYEDKSGILNAIVWGYNNQHPVVVVKNASYADVLAAVNNARGSLSLEAILISASEDPRNSSSWANFNGSLRNDPLIAGAQITTYTFKPLVGISSQTDPNGQSIYYEYDDLSRLFRTMDSDGNLLQEYKYNYVNQ